MGIYLTNKNIYFLLLHIKYISIFYTVYSAQVRFLIFRWNDFLDLLLHNFVLFCLFIYVSSLIAKWALHLWIIRDTFSRQYVSDIMLTLIPLKWRCVKVSTHQKAWAWSSTQHLSALYKYFVIAFHLISDFPHAINQINWISTHIYKCVISNYSNSKIGLNRFWAFVWMEFVEI